MPRQPRRVTDLHLLPGCPPRRPSPLSLWYGVAAPVKPLLNRPAGEVALVLARDDLDRWAKAARRLKQSDDPDAVHDFRVALRRLRSTVRAFRPQLDPLVPRRTRRRLRQLAKTTGMSRNLQVECGWVLTQLESLAAPDRAGAQWLVARLAERRQGADEQLARRLAKDFARVKRKLRRSFKVSGSSLPRSAQSITARVVVRDSLRRWTRELDHRLRGVRTVADWGDAHAARISVKRIRYLLKPFKREIAAAGATIEHLAALQDVLGGLQDSRVLADELRAGFVAVASVQAQRAYDQLFPWSAAAAADMEVSPAAHGAGLLTLARRLGAQYEATFTRLRREWLEQQAAALLLQLHELGKGRTRGAGSGARPLGSRPRRRREAKVSNSG